MVDRHLLQRIDACRPGSEDVHDADLAPLAEELAESRAARALYDRVQSADQTIAEALHDVSVPDGLSDRLLARLAMEQLVSGAEQAGLPQANSPTPSRIAESSSRRRWLRLAAGVSVALIIACSAWFWEQRRLTAENVTEDALAFYNQEKPLAAESQWLNRVAPPVAYPISRHVNRLQHTAWRRVEGFLRPELNGVAYDLFLSSTSATLYVVPMNAPSLPNAPPQNIPLVSGYQAAVAWQEGGLLYVLVVQDDRSYRTFIKGQTFT